MMVSVVVAGVAAAAAAVAADSACGGHVNNVRMITNQNDLQGLFQLKN